MATAQAAAQSAMTANTPLAAQEKTNYGLERGFMGETPPMPGPEAKMGEAPPEGAGPAAPQGQRAESPSLTFSRTSSQALVS